VTRDERHGSPDPWYFTGVQLSEEPVVTWVIRWDRLADTECCLGRAERHFAELRERPLQEAAPQPSERVTGFARSAK